MRIQDFKKTNSWRDDKRPLNIPARACLPPLRIFSTSKASNPITPTQCIWQCYTTRHDKRPMTTCPTWGPGIDNKNNCCIDRKSLATVTGHSDYSNQISPRSRKKRRKMMGWCVLVSQFTNHNSPITNLTQVGFLKVMVVPLKMT
jgi:hypothetical protein